MSQKTMPTMIFSDAAIIGDENVWRVLVGAAGALVAALAARYLYRKRYGVEIHKTESETRKVDSETRRADIDVAINILDRLPDFLHRLEDAHKKTLADETTIEKLRHELEKCVEGRRSCAELKESLVVFLTEAEAVIQKIDGSGVLLSELRRLKARMEK